MTYNHNTLGRKPKRPKPVTLIVGIIYKEEIVLACDSQTSWGNTKRTDTQKIVPVFFQGNTGCLIGQSGDATGAARTIEMIQQAASKTTMDDYRKPADIAEDALREFKQNLIRLNNWENDRDYANHFLQENAFNLLIAYRYKDKGYLFEIDSYMGIATRKQNHACIGCGATVAEFIISRSYHPDMESHEALVTAIYAVEEVKKVDAFCGGPTKIGLLLADNSMRIAIDSKEAEKMVNPVVEAINSHDAKLKEQWRASMLAVMHEAMQKIDSQKLLTEAVQGKNPKD